MHIVRTGVILNTEKFDECVSFYENVLGLDVLFSETDDDFRLTCFSFGGAYLMVETGGAARVSGRSAGESPAKLRINVPDVNAALAQLRSHGIEARIRHRAWGSSIDLCDPDGNRIGIRDDPTFIAQLERKPVNP